VVVLEITGAEEIDLLGGELVAVAGDFDKRAARAVGGAGEDVVALDDRRRNVGSSGTSLRSASERASTVFAADGLSSACPACSTQWASG